MGQAGRWARIGDWLWFVALGVASSAWCVTAAQELSATFDEPVYVAKGLEFWRTGSHAGLIKLGTMPLPVDLCTLPLHLWEQGHAVTLDPEGDLDRLLPWARAGTLVFWWLLLFYGRLAGRELAGPWGGRLAVALLASEPSLLAHACLATTDVAVTACLLALVYHFRRGRRAGWWRRVGVPALWFGAAVLAKASGLVFGGLCLLAVEGEQRFLAKPEGYPGLRGFFRDVVQLGLLGMALVFVYCGCDWQQEPSFAAWADKLPEGGWRRVMTWTAEHLRIFPNAGEAIVRQIKHNLHGHSTYLLGDDAERAIWYYFPVALTIKLSLLLLALPVLVGLVRPRALANGACLAALVLLVFSLDCRVQIGIRLVLPLIAFAAVGLASAAARACGELGPGWPRRLLAGALAAGVAWTATAAVRIWPEGLCYVNELWGGPETGYRLLSDSNYDWGQGLKELVAWQRRRGLPVLDVWYFGSDPTLFKLPLRNVQLHLPPLATEADLLARVPGRYLAAGTTMVYGNMTGSAEQHRAAAILRARRPVARTMTFLIYDLGQQADRLASR